MTHGVVIDTNVIISAALTPNGVSAKVIDYITNNEISLFYCSEILAEYREVLSREYLNIAPDIQGNIINKI